MPFFFQSIVRNMRSQRILVPHRRTTDLVKRSWVKMVMLRAMAMMRWLAKLTP